MSDVEIKLILTKTQAADFAWLVKRLARRGLGTDDLNLVTAEEAEAEDALLLLRDALAAAGFDPR